MTNTTPLVRGGLIGLKKEFEERYIILHRNTFPGVLDRIRTSNISDYSIFLHQGILFSHMVYSGADFDKDMDAMGEDATTREWWKLTDPMQEPLPGRNEGEWWAGLDLVFEEEHEKPDTGNSKRMAFRIQGIQLSVQLPDFKKILPAQPDLSQDFHRVRVFRWQQDLYIYLETKGKHSQESWQSILRNAFQLETLPPVMTEVFHTDAWQGNLSPQRKKVFVTGCFDLLHSGHVAFLQEAATYGDLYVNIGSDENVRQLKGRYPVNSQKERKYLISALSCVKSCEVNSGWGYIDFEKELHRIRPDLFVVNEDGHSPAKQALCKDMGIEYLVLKRIPHADLPSRSTTALRTECTIPFRIDLAGGWLDQPFVSTHHPGPVLTISIEPTVAFNERSGMASSTRRKAIELWNNEIPHGNGETLARILFTFENPPGTVEVAGSQDSLGIVLPGLNKLHYNGEYWPEKITSVLDEDILEWLEQHLYLVTLGPRVGSFNVLSQTHIDKPGAKMLADAANDCWEAILNKDVRGFGEAFTRSFEAQTAMFPNMKDDMIRKTIRQYEDKAWGWKLSGAGGGGYLILVAKEPIEEAMQIRIRRKSNL